MITPEVQTLFFNSLCKPLDSIDNCAPATNAHHPDRLVKEALHFVEWQTWCHWIHGCQLQLCQPAPWRPPQTWQQHCEQSSFWYPTANSWRRDLSPRDCEMSVLWRSTSVTPGWLRCHHRKAGLSPLEIVWSMKLCKQQVIRWFWTADHRFNYSRASGRCLI